MKPTNVSRRTVLATVGSIAAAGSGVALFGGTAAALNTSFNATGAATSNDNGSVREVTITDIVGTFAWDGLDSAAQQGDVSLDVHVKGSGEGWVTDVTSRSYRVNGLSGSKDFELDPINLLDLPEFDPSDFADTTEETDQYGRPSTSACASTLRRPTTVCSPRAPTSRWSSR
ncbi:hypothetical protein ACFQH6_05935 [Halobacteriaceae archaeon GCM10025711]